MALPISPLVGEMSGRTEGGAKDRNITVNASALRSDKLVPALNHVAVLVHDRVPAGDLAHTLFERAAVAHRAGLFHDGAVRRLDLALGRLALDPVAPFVLGHELLRRDHIGGIVAL